jgi:multicomponent Na+:H+ antiporter subunit G
MKDWIAAGLMLTGATFSLLAAVGVLRMPDLFTRMQATTKSATLGAGCLMLGVTVNFGDLGVAARALAVILFLFLTAPVGSHMLGRAAYFLGVPLWAGTHLDELRGRYDPVTHSCRSSDDSGQAPPEPAHAEPR